MRETTRGTREASKKLSLLATVSHEFRTPLTNLRLYAEMMAGASRMDEAERKKYLAIISDEAERLAWLVDNALKYAADGKRIDLTVGAADGMAFVDVADFGPGIPAKDARKIFRRFFRGDNSLAAGIGGAGLGLDIASGLMRGMGGSLAYRPNPAGGSVFRAAFPLASSGKDLA